MVTVTRGVVYLAFGSRCVSLAALSIGTLRSSGYSGPVAIIVDSSTDPPDAACMVIEVVRSLGGFGARAIKTNLDRFSPFDESLFLDCDTVVLNSIEPIWDNLSTNDVALALDRYPTVGKALECAPVDGRGTPAEWQATSMFSSSPYFNSGVIAWRRSSRSKRVFETWHLEWLRFGWLDQFALVRALDRCSFAPGVLDPKFNYPSLGIPDALTAMIRGIAILHFWSTEQERMQEFALQRLFDIHLF